MGTKLDEVHDAVIWIKSKMESGEVLCKTKHDVLDKRVDSIHEIVRGDDGLEKRFDRFENKAIGFTVAAMLIGQIAGSYLVEWIKK